MIRVVKVAGSAVLQQRFLLTLRVAFLAGGKCRHEGPSLQEGCAVGRSFTGLLGVIALCISEYISLIQQGQKFLFSFLKVSQLLSWPLSHQPSHPEAGLLSGLHDPCRGDRPLSQCLASWGKQYNVHGCQRCDLSNNDDFLQSQKLGHTAFQFSLQIPKMMLPFFFFF